MRGARYKRSPKEERTWNGKAYDSKKEMRRAQELALLVRLGKISDLREQVKYELVPKQEGERAMNYVADFVYREAGVEQIEDVKGHKTEVYRMKKKLMLQKYGIRILET